MKHAINMVRMKACPSLLTVTFNPCKVRKVNPIVNELLARGSKLASKSSLIFIEKQ